MVKPPRIAGTKGPYVQADAHLLGTQRLEVKAVMNDAASTAIQIMATERTKQDKEHTKQSALFALVAGLALGAVTFIALVGTAVAIKCVAAVAGMALASLGASTGVRGLRGNKSQLALPDPATLFQPPDPPKNSPP